MEAAVHERVVKAGRAACSCWRPQRERDAPSRFTTSWRPVVRGRESPHGAGARAHTASGRCPLTPDMRDLYLRSLYANRRTLTGLVGDHHLISFSSDRIRSCACVFPDWIGR